MSTTSTAVDLTAAATAAAALVPAPVPLVPAPLVTPPPADAVAVVAGVVGDGAAEVALVLGAQVALALAEGTGGTIDPAAALQPALLAASDALGGGVLEPARTEVAGSVVGPDSEVVALDGAGGTHAWLVVRRRAGGAPAGAAPAVPTQRGAALRALYDVELTLTAEIGRARLPLREVLDLTPGTVLELDRAAGGPADVVVNGRLVARGEVVVVDEDFAIRITEIVSGTDAG